MVRQISFLFICILLQNTLLAQNEVKGDYFSQNPHGMTPEVFAPGFISTDEWEAAGCFSPDGKEYYFTQRPTKQGAENRIYFTKMVNGKWATPALAPFAKDIFEFESFISPDGKELFLHQTEPNRQELQRTERSGILIKPTMDGANRNISARRLMIIS